MSPFKLNGRQCTEASAHSTMQYIPCCKSAQYIVWHDAIDQRAYPMCRECAYHNVKNRGGKIIGIIISENDSELIFKE